jgi:hypothetical protein
MASTLLDEIDALPLFGIAIEDRSNVTPDAKRSQVPDYIIDLGGDPARCLPIVWWARLLWWN